MDGQKMKKLSALILFLISFVALSGLASAAVTIEKVKLNNDEISNTSTNMIRGVERGEEFDVKVELTSDTALSDVQVEVSIMGVHNEEVEDQTDTFDMKANVTYVKKLTLRLPDRMDQDTYRLRVRVEDRSGDTVQTDYTLEVDAPRNLVTIKDIVFSPENEVKAGRSLLATVRIKNMGEEDEDGVKVKVSVPALGISASDYIDELEADDSTTSEELYMRIPTCATAGEYQVKVTVEFDDGDEKTTEYETITVVEDETCIISVPTGPAGVPSAQETTLTVPESRDISRGGSGVVYPITITNAGASSVTYTLSITGVDAWGTYSLDPSNVLVVPAGGTSTSYLYVAANSNTALGVYSFAVGVTTAAGTETVALEANVVEGEAVAVSEAGGLRKALEVGLVVLVILLVILGLIIGFNKMRGGEEEAEEGPAGETYY